MRKGIRRSAVGLVATLAICIGLNTARSQDGVQYFSSAQPATNATGQSDEIDGLRRRLDAYEAELNALRAQQQQPQSGLPAPTVAYEASNVEAAPAPTCTEVELITKPQMRIIGRLFLDVVNFEDNTPSPVFDGNDRQNECGFGAARFGFSGYIYENVYAQLELDFANAVKYKDTYIEAQNLPLIGHFKAGFFKEPVNLEDQISDNDLLFMNRSLALRTFSPSRRWGGMAYDHVADNENLSWFLGTFASNFSDTAGTLAQDAGDWTFDGRLAWLPIYDEPSDGRYLVHLGGSYSYRSNAPNDVKFSTKPELGLLDTGFLSTTVTGDTDYNQLGGEFLVIWGPASVQSEVYFADANAANQFSGGYVEASYFLTGDNRGYKREEKTLGRVKPIEDFFRVSTADGVCMGKGAWELKVRYSFVDLDEGTPTVLSGGVLSTGYENSYSAGVNWYWSPYTRMMFDYVWEDVHRTNGLSAGEGSAGMRWQVSF